MGCLARRKIRYRAVECFVEIACRSSKCCSGARCAAVTFNLVSPRRASWQGSGMRYTGNYLELRTVITDFRTRVLIVRDSDLTCLGLDSVADSTYCYEVRLSSWFCSLRAQMGFLPVNYHNKIPLTHFFRHHAPRTSNTINLNDILANVITLSNLSKQRAIYKSTHPDTCTSTHIQHITTPTPYHTPSPSTLF
jgi:hypothetical protein